jgi:hypothetical protein
MSMPYIVGGLRIINSIPLRLNKPEKKELEKSRKVIEPAINELKKYI